MRKRWKKEKQRLERDRWEGEERKKWGDGKNKKKLEDGKIGTR